MLQPTAPTGGSLEDFEEPQVYVCLFWLVDRVSLTTSSRFGNYTRMIHSMLKMLIIHAYG